MGTITVYTIIAVARHEKKNAFILNERHFPLSGILISFRMRREMVAIMVSAKGIRTAGVARRSNLLGIVGVHTSA